MNLFRDLRGMGETNAVIERRKNFSRGNTLMRACEIYEADYADGPGGFRQLLNSSLLPDGRRRAVSRDQFPGGAVKCP